MAIRDIIFRGKRIDNGKWIEGAFVPENNVYSATIFYGPRSSIGEYVDPSTVGQYTGLTDKNGKRIFEGDIVAFKRVNALGYTTSRIGEVRYYDKLPIFYIMASTGDAWDWCACEEIEVIGTIHDNPELVKEG